MIKLILLILLTGCATSSPDDIPPQGVSDDQTIIRDVNGEDHAETVPAKRTKKKL